MNFLFRLTMAILVLVTSLFGAAQTPHAAISGILNLTSAQEQLNYELFRRLRNKSFLGDCFRQEQQLDHVPEAKAVRKQIELINVVGLHERTLYFSDDRCESLIEVNIGSRPYKVLAQIQNRFLIEFLGDAFTGIIGFVDVFNVTEQGVETTAEDVKVSSDTDQLLRIPMNGVNFRRIR